MKHLPDGVCEGGVIGVATVIVNCPLLLNPDRAVPSQHIKWDSDKTGDYIRTRDRFKNMAENR